MVLLISASQVARITGMSHWCPHSTKKCLKKEGERENGNRMEGVNLFKVHCVHIGNPLVLLAYIDSKK
jgi:hypothetical protein